MYRPHTLLARLRSGAKRLVISMTLELAALELYPPPHPGNLQETHSRVSSAIGTPRDVTGEGTLSRVSELMSLEIAALRSTIPTPRDVTGEGTISRVNASMSLEIAVLCSSIPIPRDLTGEGTHSLVVL